MVKFILWWIMFDLWYFCMMIMVVKFFDCLYVLFLEGNRGIWGVYCKRGEIFVFNWIMYEKNVCMNLNKKIFFF